MVVKVLITGITGLVGSSLALHIISNIPDVEVHGLKRIRSDSRAIYRLRGRVTLHDGDVEDPYVVAEVVRKVKPDRVFHLAAQSYPSESWDSPVTTLRTNVEGTVNVLEAVRKHAPAARVHIAGSSAEYGPLSPEEVPVKEDHALCPVSPYGVSKVTQELLGLQYRKSYNLFVIVTRSFNQIGRFQGDNCSIQSFCKQAALIEAGMKPPVIKVGNLTAQRDFTHIDDVVSALWLLLEHGTSGLVYNICSNLATSMQDIMDKIVARAKVPVIIETDPAKMRPVDEPILVGDNSLLRKHTGWAPKISVDGIIDDVLEFWREQIAFYGINKV